MNSITTQKVWYEAFNYFYLSGKDSKKFLNGITSSNILENKSKFIKTCWLKPTGNLRAILEIYNVDNKLLIIVLEGNLDEVKDYCESMIFPTDDVKISKIFDCYRVQKVNESNSWRSFEPVLLLDDSQNDFYTRNNFQILSNEELNIWKFKHAIPALNKEIDGKNNPLELGLRDLVDFKKGCYLGQETMAKLKNISFLKQEIRVWKTKKNTTKANTISNKKIYLSSKKERIVGSITSFSRINQNNYIGLAMIKRSFLKGYSCFFSEDFGELLINQSISSVFL